MTTETEVAVMGGRDHMPGNTGGLWKPAKGREQILS